jgi:4-aminobutyrate aminotransferase/(S)-3-amino-2-methylpropionate transaminase
VLGFDNSHHGNSTACLSVSSPDANPNNLPAFPWPKAPYPQLKYPIAEYEHYNNAEEDRCIGEVERIINSKGAWGEMGAMIVEPISSINN